MLYILKVFPLMAYVVQLKIKHIDVMLVLDDFFKVNKID